ncbi:MAG: hypothetical protein CMH57_13975 [Myxococcales bacterium]|nr:hypothetical protein [Myxococcales bacterium]
MRRALLITALLLTSSLTLTSALADDPAELAKDLSRLRSEVEALNSDIELERDSMRSRLRALSAQKADLELELQRENLRMRQLEDARTKRETRIASTSSSEDLLKPSVSKIAAALKERVEAGLPFKTEERLADLERIEEQLERGLIKPSDALSRLWSRYEDELRLTRENGLYKQVVVVDGEEVLADVARLGMVAMYFKTPTGGYGRMVREGAGWVAKPYTRPENAEQVAALFDAFQKNIRVGFFTLPNAFPGTKE